MDGGLNRIVDYNVAGLTLKGGSQEDPRRTPGGPQKHPLGGCYSSSHCNLKNPHICICVLSISKDVLGLGCAVFKSVLHENREVVLAVGGYGQATAEVYDYTQTNASWAMSNF